MPYDHIFHCTAFAIPVGACPLEVAAVRWSVGWYDSPVILLYHTHTQQNNV